MDFTTLVIVIPTNEKKVMVSDIIESLAAVTPVAFSGLVTYKQKTDGLIGRAYGFLGIGPYLVFSSGNYMDRRLQS